MDNIIGTLTGIGCLRGELTGSSALTGVLSASETLTGVLSGIATLQGVLTGIGTLSGELSTPPAGDTPAYTGSYEYTPSGEQQVVPISGLRATQNITINAIPENYGLITWNGAYLTVS